MNRDTHPLDVEHVTGLSANSVDLGEMDVETLVVERFDDVGEQAEPIWSADFDGGESSGARGPHFELLRIMVP